MAKREREGSRTSRARVILGVVIALLILLLSVLGVYFVRVLTPARQVGGPDGGTNGLVWVRSLYGFGPSTAEQLLAPTSVAIAPNGEIYATDPQMHRIMVFRPDGSFARLLHTGAGGAAKGQFYRPESIDIDDRGDVYIADSFTSKVIVFNSAGKYLREWVMPKGDDEIPRGIYVTDDEVYLLTIGKLHVYNKQGRELGKMGTRGRKPAQIDAYQGVVEKDGMIYIADALNRRVQAVSKDGKSVWITPREEQDSVSDKAPYQLPQDLCFDGRGRLVTIDAFKFEIVVSDPKDGAVKARYGKEGRDEGQFWYPSSIDYDPERDWFAVADTTNNRIQIVRIPESGGGAQSALRRSLSSPYRYCAIPLALLLLVVLIAAITSRRIRRRQEEAEQAELLEGAVA